MAAALVSLPAMGDLLRVETAIRMSTADGRVRWEPPADALVDVAGEQFVKLSKAKRGFARLVFHMSPDVPKPVPCEWTLAMSVGVQAGDGLAQ